MCSSVWVKPEDNPWATLAMQAIAPEVMLAPPDPDGQQVGEPARERIASAVMAKVSTYEVDDGTVGIPGVARCIVGTK